MDEIYECGFCGEEFEDEEECGMHEAECDENPDNNEE